MEHPKTAIITGASRGLGRALAGELAARNWRLAIDARGAGALRQVADELSDQTDVAALPGDVTDADHRRELVGAAVDLGPIRCIVNNASTLGPSPLPELLELSSADLRQIYETNVVAPIALIREVAAELTEGSAIVNVTSDAGVEPYPAWGGYGSSKSALEHATAIFAAEHPELRVYAFDPGDMQTRMHQRAFPDEDITDRPNPESVAPRLAQLVEGVRPSGRYRAEQLESAA